MDRKVGLMLPAPLAQSFPLSISSPGMIWGFAVAVALVLWRLYYRAYQRIRPAAHTQPSKGTATGSVYILSNPEYPNLVKIGQTGRTAQERADELSAHTGVPTPFSVEYEFRVPDPEDVEQTVHDALSEHSVNPNREFFEVSVATARHTIEQVTGASAGRPGRSRLRQALGLGLTVLSIGISLLLLTCLNGRVQKVLDGFGAHVASRLIQDTFGYPTLLLSGGLGVWGAALLRRRPLRPLWIPSLCVLALCPLLSALAGWTGHAFQTTKQIGWGGQTTTFPPEFVPWAGAFGRAMAEWTRTTLGPTVSLGLLILATTVASALALRLHERFLFKRP